MTYDGSSISQVFRCWLTSIVKYLFAFFVDGGAVWNGLIGSGVVYDDRMRRLTKKSSCVLLGFATQTNNSSGEISMQCICDSMKYTLSKQNQSRVRFSTIGKVIRLTLLDSLRLSYNSAIFTSSYALTHARQDMPAIINHICQVVVATN